MAVIEFDLAAYTSPLTELSTFGTQRDEARRTSRTTVHLTAVTIQGTPERLPNVILYRRICPSLH